MATTNIKLEKLSIDELLLVREKIEAQLSELAKAELAELEAKIDALKSFAGKRRKSPGTRGKVPAKYRDPKTGKTWSGRGMTPVWLREAEESGKKRKAFAI